MASSALHISTMNSANYELMNALKTLLEIGKYSDLTIVCGMKRYAVHRAIICSRSGFFDGACSNPFREAESGVIDLSEDDPEAIDHMVHYFYHLDYLSTPRTRSRGASLNSLSASPNGDIPLSPISPMMRSFNIPRKLNLAMVEDPLLATAASSYSTNTQESSPSTPTGPGFPLSPPDSVRWFHGKYATSLDSRMEEHDDEDSDAASVDLEPNFSGAHLTIHAKVYAIAEKYGIQALKSLAKKKFAIQMAYHWESAEFPEAIQEAYETTVDSDRGLRDVVISTFRAYPELAQRRDVEAIARETPGLAWELFRVGWGLPMTSS
jgi:hypothetical protein